MSVEFVNMVQSFVMKLHAGGFD